MSRLRILQCMAGAPHGGAETAFVELCLALHGAGQQIEVATRPHPIRVPRLEQAGIRVHRLRFGGALDHSTPARLRRIIRDFRPDIVQTWMSRAARKTPQWSPRTGLPYYPVIARLGGYYKLKNYAGTDFFITNTADIARYLTDEGVPPERVVHIDNFTEAQPPQGALTRASFDTPQDVPLLLALGRLHRAKAFDTLLRALARVPHAWLWIAGEGPERRTLERLATETGLRDRVRFIGWREDRADLFRLADLCVFPSRHEPFGNVVIQAWAHRVPLITTNATGPARYVREGQDALVTAIDDEDALARAIERLLNDPELQARLVEAGHRRYLEGFTKERCVRDYLDFYRHCIASASPDR